MPLTYQLIASNTLTTSAASVTFSAIPNTYTDLVLRMSTRVSDTTFGNETFLVTLNGVSTGGQYSNTLLLGNGSSAFSFRTTSTNKLDLGSATSQIQTSNTFSNNEVYFPSYTVAQNKPIADFSVNENNATSANIRAYAALWRNTAAITSIMVEPNNSWNFLTGSSFFLYGIKNT